MGHSKKHAKYDISGFKKIVALSDYFKQKYRQAFIFV
jgi:hypothetical protein